MPSDDKLARKKSIKEDDLIGLPLFCSEQSWNADISRWCGNRMDELHLEGKVTIAASSPDLMEAFIEAGDPLFRQHTAWRRRTGAGFLLQQADAVR